MIEFCFRQEEVGMNASNLKEQGRNSFGVPLNSKLVLCRHGGSATFNIPFVRVSLAQLVHEFPELHIILMNTDR